MTPMIGEYALSAAMLTSLAIFMAAIAYAVSRNPGLLRAMRWGTALLAVLVSASSWSLLQALLNDNFALHYVAQHSEKALAFGYKIAAFWAGQEGSLLFWAWVLSLMGVVMAFRMRRKDDGETAVALATMAAVTGFFTVVMLFAGNPFQSAETAMADGQGLNPALQNFAMVAHPPMLFLGYAGFTAPFALMLGALLTGRKDTGWLRDARAWMIYSWTTLTVGILLGAQWAYVELGWGGYWAWDPVENASLLPWLTGTALLHSAVLATHRGMFKRWTAALTAASFLLCVFGTYLTRSGVIQSVHSFEQSPIGTYFLVFMLLIALVSVGTIVFRLNLLSGEHKLEALLSREGLFLAANVLLVVMTAVTLVGTVFPLLSSAFSQTPVTVAGPFYNKVILPMALLLAGLMSLGPVVGFGAAAAHRAKGKLMGMALVGAVAAAATALLGITSPWAVAAGAIVAAVIAGVLIDLFTTIPSMIRAEGSARTAIAKALASRTRHWGAQLAHLGLAAIVAGVVGSSVYRIHDASGHQFKRGETQQIGAYTITYAGLEDVRRPNHLAKVATLAIKESGGRTFELQPERRFYDRGSDPGQPASEVAIRFGLGSDVYVTLAGWDDNGAIATFELYVNPLVNWIWIGGGLLTLGGLVCLIPTGKRDPVAAPEAAAVREVPEVEPMGHTARERRRARRPTQAITTGRR